MRIGLTQLNPNKEFPLPLYALPDLVTLGPSWLYAITKTHNMYTAQQQHRQEELTEALRQAQGFVAGMQGNPPQEENPEHHENLMLQEALFNYRRAPKVIQSKIRF